MVVVEPDPLLQHELGHEFVVEPGPLMRRELRPAVLLLIVPRPSPWCEAYESCCFTQSQSVGQLRLRLSVGGCARASLRWWF